MKISVDIYKVLQISFCNDVDLEIILWGKSQSKWWNPVLSGSNQEITALWSLSNDRAK